MDQIVCDYTSKIDFWIKATYGKVLNDALVMATNSRIYRLEGTTMHEEKIDTNSPMVPIAYCDSGIYYRDNSSDSLALWFRKHNYELEKIPISLDNWSSYRIDVTDTQGHRIFLYHPDKLDKLTIISIETKKIEEHEIPKGCRGGRIYRYQNRDTMCSGRSFWDFEATQPKFSLVPELSEHQLVCGYVEPHVPLICDTKNNLRINEYKGTTDSSPILVTDSRLKTIQYEWNDVTLGLGASFYALGPRGPIEINYQQEEQLSHCPIVATATVGKFLIADFINNQSFVATLVHKEKLDLINYTRSLLSKFAVRDNYVRNILGTRDIKITLEPSSSSRHMKISDQLETIVKFGISIMISSLHLGYFKVLRDREYEFVVRYHTIGDERLKLILGNQEQLEQVYQLDYEVQERQLYLPDSTMTVVHNGYVLHNAIELMDTQGNRARKPSEYLIIPDDSNSNGYVVIDPQSGREYYVDESSLVPTGTKKPFCQEVSIRYEDKVINCESEFSLIVGTNNRFFFVALSYDCHIRVIRVKEH